MRIPRVLVIAGYDPVAGAGVLSDVKTVEAVGGYGIAVVTCIAIQNTCGVRRVVPIDSADVKLQLDVVLEDVSVDAVKIGVLPDERVIDVVADSVSRLGIPIVVDPVIAPTYGPRFLDEVSVNALKERLIPVATLVTPNVKEAEELTGFKIVKLDDVARAAKVIVDELGSKAVLVKGFKSGGLVIDYLYTDEGLCKRFVRPDMGFDVHGLGCVLSSAIATYLAMGLDLVEAVSKGIEFAIEAARTSIRVGMCRACPNHLANLRRDSFILESIERLRKALDKLLRERDIVADLIPEVGMNIVEAPPHPYPRGVEDCVGIEGRVRRVRDNVLACGCVARGVSSHIARAVLEAQKCNPEIRAAANIRYFEGIERVAKEVGLRAVFVDRRKEPEEVKRVEGASIPWIVEEACRELGTMPDIIYDLGDVGKEAMARIFGRNLEEVIDKLLKLGRALKRTVPEARYASSKNC